MNISIPKSHLFLDKRRLDKQGRGSLNLVVTRHGQRAMLSLGINVRPDQWDGEIINHPDKRILNTAISAKKADFDRAMIQLCGIGALTGKTPKDIINTVLESIDPSIREEREKHSAQEKGIECYFGKYIAQKTNVGTIGIYNATLRKLGEYCHFSNIELSTLQFEDINKSWLESFQAYCLQTSNQNTVAIHLRNIRAIFNYAIDDERTVHYPFRKFHIRHEATKDKAYSAKELRTFFNYKCSTQGEREAQDMFKLMFCLIGINIIDLTHLSSPVKGRIEFNRAKTHKPYSIKLEPEAIEIINKYKGSKSLLNCLERIPNFKTYSRRIRKNLCKIGIEHIPGKRNIGRAILPDICTGSARTSWATIAQEELDIPRDVIAAALGHHTVDVTSTYLRTNWKKKVDSANRKVIDWVLYEKRS